jgi:hypothetical protein
MTMALARRTSSSLGVNAALMDLAWSGRTKDLLR